MRVLDYTAYIGFIVALIALPFLIFNWVRFAVKKARSVPMMRNQVPVPMKTVLLFAIPLVIAMGASETSKEIGHSEVLRKLQSLRSDCRVSVNGQAIANPTQVLTVLKSMDWLPAHHSNPTRRISVEISNAAPGLVLSLARDSSDSREYWVFWPKYRVTAVNEIGRIKTPVFDSY